MPYGYPHIFNSIIHYRYKKINTEVFPFAKFLHFPGGCFGSTPPRQEKGFSSDVEKIIFAQNASFGPKSETVFLYRKRKNLFTFVKPYVTMYVVKNGNYAENTGSSLVKSNKILFSFALFYWILANCFLEAVGLKYKDG